MTRADYQLKHQLYGTQGSLWERQVNATTRDQIRGIVEAAGGSSLVAAADTIAASVARVPSVLVEDVYFQFAAGNFAVIGQQQRDYDFRRGDSDGGKRLQVAYREGSADTTTAGLPTLLARVSNDFMRVIQETTLPEDRDWYLVPIPRGMTPIVIEGRDDLHLVNGVDFLAYDGYIALTDDPEQVLPTGVVRVSAARVETNPPTLGALMDPGRPGMGRYLSEYAKKTQSLWAFQRAAAEYAGLYVTQSPDVVLGVVSVSETVTIYHLAVAGPVRIDYPHVALSRNQALPSGFIVCDQFDVVASRYGDTANLKKAAAASWGKPIRLDGVLPVNGLTWDGLGPVAMDSVSLGPGDIPHIRLHFDGSDFNKGRLWEFQRLHEVKTGVFLYDALSEPDLPSTVDFWDLLETFYGTQLFLLLAANHSPRINVRLWRFAAEHRPQSANMLLGIDLGVDETTLTLNNQGVPLLEETGDDYYTAGGVDGYDNYYRPDGVSLYVRPFGAGYYIRPD